MEENKLRRLNLELLTSDFKMPEDVSLGPTGDLPERVIQFGEGNFLRSFINWMIDRMNKEKLFNGKALVIQPIPQGLINVLDEQDGLYTLFLRGLDRGEIIEEKAIISSINRTINPYSDWEAYLKSARQADLRFVISNTTEAGIAYLKEDMPKDKSPSSFPAKLLAFLYERYKAFDGDLDKGMIILPCELIDRNADNLKAIILRLAEEWELEEAFIDWIHEANYFLNTLVDRIATGYPREEIDEIQEYLGYEDRMLDTAEFFHLWVIEGDKALEAELPLREAGLNVLWVENLTPYRDRKVRILNGAHTMTVLMAYLYGLDSVRDCIEDDLVLTYMKKGLFEEIIPILDLDLEEKMTFAEAVLDRFANPFIEHKLLSIALNSVSKWKVRVLPSILDYVSLKKSLPKVLSFSLASLILFYRGYDFDGISLEGERDGKAYSIEDDGEILEFFAKVWEAYDRESDIDLLCQRILSREDFWDMDLREIPAFEKMIRDQLKNILDKGLEVALEDLIKKNLGVS